MSRRNLERTIRATVSIASAASIGWLVGHKVGRRIDARAPLVAPFGFWISLAAGILIGAYVGWLVHRWRSGED